MAIELGSTLLGEIILFAVPATALVLEYLRSNIIQNSLRAAKIQQNTCRQARKESKKEEELFIEKLELVNTVNDIAFYVEHQDVQLKRIKSFLAALGSSFIFV